MTDFLNFAKLLSNLTRHEPLNIDPILFADSPNKGSDLSFNETRPAVSADLWSRQSDDISYIGIRVTDPITDKFVIATSLAAAAVERKIVPIFLSWIGQCGMQQFGFRVEMIGGLTEVERRACEEQLKRLWNFAIIVDAADITSFD